MRRKLQDLRYELDLSSQLAAFQHACHLPASRKGCKPHMMHAGDVQVAEALHRHGLNRTKAGQTAVLQARPAVLARPDMFNSEVKLLG